MDGVLVLPRLLLLLGCAAAQANQCNEDEATQLLLFPPLPTDDAVASVLNDIHQRSSTAVCTPQTVRPCTHCLCRVH